jgi:hypothetical protein
MEEVLRWMEQRLKKELQSEKEKVNNTNPQKEQNPVTNNETPTNENRK